MELTEETTMCEFDQTDIATTNYLKQIFAKLGYPSKHGSFINIVKNLKQL